MIVHTCIRPEPARNMMIMKVRNRVFPPAFVDRNRHFFLVVKHLVSDKHSIPAVWLLYGGFKLDFLVNRQVFCSHVKGFGTYKPGTFPRRYVSDHFHQAFLVINDIRVVLAHNFGLESVFNPFFWLQRLDSYEPFAP